LETAWIQGLRIHSLNPKSPDIEVGRIARLKLVGKVVRKIERL